MLSLLAVRSADRWKLLAGSLLTVPDDVARMSWKLWAEAQPHTREQALDPGGFDLGVEFDEKPFDGLRAVRRVVKRARWSELVSQINNGLLESNSGDIELSLDAWSHVGFLGLGSTSMARGVVAGARRPVSAVLARTHGPAPPASTRAIWERDSSAGTWRDRRVLHWPQVLLGIDWLGTTDHDPPAAFVIGRMHTDAWIADVVPDHESELLQVMIAWDAEQVDPLGCSLLTRCERDDLVLLTRLIRISDLPMNDEEDQREARGLGWQKRILNVGVPRGARRTDWGVQLLAPDGRLLDELAVVPRVEQVSIATRIAGSPEPAFTTVAGDQRPVPSPRERDEAVAAAIEIEAEARRAASQRRVATAGELESYLRRRFSCRAGELLILDPHLLDSRPGEVIEFLGRLRRPVRGLTRSVPRDATARLEGHVELEIRALPHGKRALHDRVWLVGETGLLVGTSVNSFLGRRDARPQRATTVAELPHADAAAWRRQFEAWWRMSERAAKQSA